jgi:hypothetical protein
MLLQAKAGNMKNRSTDLIDWNNALSEGTGLSGSHYALTFDRSNEDSLPIKCAERRWLIAVDGSIVCSASSVQDALARSEGLEALRCILQGRCDRISDEHCRVAELTASEMLEAATQALTHSLPVDRGSHTKNVDALQALSSAIRSETLKRQRESMLDTSPPLN